MKSIFAGALFLSALAFAAPESDPDVGLAPSPADPLQVQEVPELPIPAHERNVVVPIPPELRDRRWRVGLGFPEMASVQMVQRVAKRLELAIGVGFLPVSLIADPFNKIPTQDISDDYEIQVDPFLHVFVPHVAAYFRPEGQPWWLRFTAGLVIVDAVGRGIVRNKETGNTVSLARVDAVLYQPTMGIAMGYPLVRSAGLNVEVALGVACLFPTSLYTSITGAIPAYVSVVPEAIDSYDDALAIAREELSSTLERLKQRPFVIPTLSIQLAF